jgi:hypothetical protein
MQMLIAIKRKELQLKFQTRKEIRNLRDFRNLIKVRKWRKLLMSLI